MSAYTREREAKLSPMLQAGSLDKLDSEKINSVLVGDLNSKNKSIGCKTHNSRGDVFE